MPQAIDPAKLEQAIRDLIIEKAKTVKDQALMKARRKCPVDRGMLQLSLRGGITIEEDGVVIWIGSSLPYAIMVEYCRFKGWFDCDAKNPKEMWKTKREKMEFNLSNPRHPVKVNPVATIPFIRPSLFEAISELK